MRAQKPDLAPEFTSNSLLNIDDCLICTDEIIDGFTMNDDGNDDDGCSGDNNEDDGLRLIKPTKTSVNGAVDRYTYDIHYV